MLADMYHMPPAFLFVSSIMKDFNEMVLLSRFDLATLADMIAF